MKILRFTKWFVGELIGMAIGIVLWLVLPALAISLVLFLIVAVFQHPVIVVWSVPAFFVIPALIPR